MSQRRLALVLGISRNTVAKKLKILAEQARLRQAQWFQTQSFTYLQFDDLETFEHSKCKPVTITMCVDKNRKIIGYAVARIPAKGHLAKIAQKKYGYRENESYEARRRLFSSLKSYVSPTAEISSDKHPQYQTLVSQNFPKSSYTQFKAERAAIIGQGELKKKKFDPLFRINHTLAMLRANINRLIRRTWCTTKSLEGLEDHLALYVDFHNRALTS